MDHPRFTSLRRCAGLPVLFLVALAAPASRADVLLYAADGVAFSEDVRARIAAENLDALGQIDVVDARSIVLTAELLADYDAVLTWGNQSYEDSIATGDALADFSDAGGGVVVCAFGTSSSTIEGIKGRFVDGDYLATSQGARAPDAALSMAIGDASHRIMDGVASFSGGIDSGHSEDLVPTTGASVVASWSNGEPLVVAHEPAGRSVVVNAFPVSDDAWSGGWAGETDGGRLLANALWWSIGAVCGDGFAEAPEACDDGNDDDTDACVECAAAVCGDGAVQGGVEACDDGNADDEDDCRNDCTIAEAGTISGSSDDGDGDSGAAGSESSDAESTSAANADSSGDTSTGVGSTAGTSGADATDDGASIDEPAPSSCNCRSGADATWLVALLLLAGVRRQRRCARVDSCA